MNGGILIIKAAAAGRSNTGPIVMPPKPAFCPVRTPADMGIITSGSEKMRNGIWTHIPSEEEAGKMEAYYQKQEK